MFYGGKATIADAMKILDEVWIVGSCGDDAKYAWQDSIQHCWRKANILPLNWNTLIDQALGTTSMSMHMKMLSNEDCSTLCNLMSSLMTCCRESNIDTNAVA